MRVFRLVAFVLVLLVAAPAQRVTGQNLAFSLFERYLDSLREQADIPGLSAAIVYERDVVWERGFGFEDVADGLRARPDTPYPVADLTQTLASTLALVCVEQNYLELDDPVQDWNRDISDDSLTIRHVLSHARSPADTRPTSSTAPPGFRYDAARFVALTPVIEYCFDDTPYAAVLAKELLDRLGMADSVPGTDLADPANPLRASFSANRLDQYERVLQRLAVPYEVDSRGRPTQLAAESEGANASTGLVSTVRDLARFDAALDDLILLEEDTLDLVRSRAVREVVDADGDVHRDVLPMGLGWFVQTYDGFPLIWHFGLTAGGSSLILKAPSRDATLILLANSDGLTASFPLSQGDVTVSVFARLFLRLFVDLPSSNTTIDLAP